MIICTTSEQLIEWTKCKHFQIDLSFKRVAGEMNEFEVNYYNLSITLYKAAGHSGDALNDQSDRLAKEGATSTNIFVPKITNPSTMPFI